VTTNQYQTYGYQIGDKGVYSSEVYE